MLDLVIDFLEQEAQQSIPRRGRTEGVALSPSWLNWGNASSYANNIQIVFTWRHHFCCVDRWWSSEAPNYQKWTKFIKVLKLRSSKGGKHSSENWPKYCSKSFWFHRKMTKERKKVELTWTPSGPFSLQVFLPLSLFCPLVINPDIMNKHLPFTYTSY